MAVTTARTGSGDVLGDLARDLQKIADSATDYAPVDSRRIGFYVGADREESNEVAVTIDDADHDQFVCTQHMQNQMANDLDIPRRHWDRLRDNYPGLLQSEVGTILLAEPHERMIRTLDESARAYVSTKYRRLDNYALMEHSILPVLAEAGEERVKPLRASLTETRMYLKLLFPEIVFPDPRGGEVYGGIVIGNSEVGAGSLFVDPFTYSSYCDNGMVWGGKSLASYGLRQRHVGRRIDGNEEGIFSEATLRKDDEAFFAMAHDLIAGSFNGIRFAAIREAIESAAGMDVPTDDVPKAVEKLGKANGLRDAETKSMMTHLIEGGNLSAWGWINAVTRTARDIEDEDRRVELERVGADLLSRPKELLKVAASA